MSYLPASHSPVGLTEEQEMELVKTQTQMKDRLNEIIDNQKADERARKFATIGAIVGAVFAAVRLGILFAPKARFRSSSQS